MERKTQITADEGKQELTITREFDLPLDLLFKAYVEAEIVEQWMGTKVLKLENKQHGSYRFETSDAKGNVVFRCNGVIHEFIPERKLPELLRWKTRRFPYSWSFLNSKN